MRGLIQRVTNASVTVNGEIIGAIDQGLLLLLGVEKEDDSSNLHKLVHKVINYRIFADDEGKMNLSLLDIKGGILVVSQFTLAAETRKGLRPGFSTAAPPAEAEQLYLAFVDKLRNHAEIDVATGEFGADMQVALVNDGPVTFLLET